ncbi:antibiotic biosynthesis monooxygenase family protein [Dongia deserti]|uniref:antibiotic biosynthesis monooxygenase family protein n=1 Tax=Dongia deserti TaxID=2268030 RepID=UPI000E648401|nr:antibiotic biosynthesis monooxygenase [Dongia deserti]
MIVRMWRGQAKASNADAYERFVTSRVFTELPALEGHRGAYLLKRSIGEEVEFIAVTLWESRDAIRKFAGDSIDHAVVEPEARAVLSSFDDFVRHFELAYGDCPAPQDR